MPKGPACPICQQPVPVPQDQEDGQVTPSFAPFCCERCRLVDLQRWMSGDYAVSRTMDFDDIDVIEREQP